VVVSPGVWSGDKLCEPQTAHSWLLLQALFITVLRDKPSHSPSPAGFAYLEFSWTPAPSLFSSVEKKGLQFV
jgi:hypothetical protein